MSRLATVLGGGEPQDSSGRSSDRSPPVVVAGALGLAVAVVVAVALSGGAVVGFACGSAVAFGVLRLASFARARGSATLHGPAESVGRQIPAALDLLAACLSAGAAPAQALAAVGDAFDGEVGAVLSAVARLAMLGAPIETAWSACLNDRRWAPIARAVIRAHYSGAALTDVLVHLADDRRRALRADAQIAAQRAGVKAVLPLGVCFLPAFVLVGVVPVVAGFAHALWR